MNSNKKGFSIVYNDDWILLNWEDFHNWSELCKAYNAEFNTEIKYNTFKSHCNRELNLNFHYTQEEENWLKENYPKLGKVKSAEEFNRIFHTKRTPNGISSHCKRMGLRVTDERKRQMAIENTGNYHEIGTIVPKVRGKLFIKQEEGWIQLSRYLLKNTLKDIPKESVVIFLDGNNKNLSLDNLAIVTRSQMALMTANKFWSKDAVLTQTGIVWTELYQALQNK